MQLPAYDIMQRHVCSALVSYWPPALFCPTMLPVVRHPSPTAKIPLRLEAIDLPEWAAEFGINGKILVPLDACINGNDWKSVDWWLAIFLLLECWHERVWELERGPIHSFSFRLVGWDPRVWDHAWVNRIALFMRAWAANQHQENSAEMFGPLAVGSVRITHDVDAIIKTIPIRIKQSVFCLVNVFRHIASAQFRKAANRLAQAIRFLFGREDWWKFEYLLNLEKKNNIRAHFNFYADGRKKNFKRWLLDPDYDVASSRVRKLIENIDAQGGSIGIHPTYDAWQSGSLICSQRQLVSAVAGSEVSIARQHWLRFSWAQTWRAQEYAGIVRDTTLMFNDRPGFRASAALDWAPWSPEIERAHQLSELPTVLMDSHLYDYLDLNDAQRESEIAYWLDEVRQVSGQVAVLWHPHTLTDDYGWTAGFIALLKAVNKDKNLYS